MRTVPYYGYGRTFNGQVTGTVHPSTVRPVVSAKGQRLRDGYVYGRSTVDGWYLPTDRSDQPIHHPVCPIMSLTVTSPFPPSTGKACWPDDELSGILDFLRHNKQPNGLTSEEQDRLHQRAQNCFIYETMTTDFGDAMLKGGISWSFNTSSNVSQSRTTLMKN